ncbi:mandelate racemase/muconate lactonizing enzyme family protein [Orrella sp. JC864]|uniref:mandelate racemase/muconate lactonizing enzyme family protein n=1 Tax=Orrella sp. JC864 TaxID=3120298 RepID=UPI00300BE9FD
MPQTRIPTAAQCPAPAGASGPARGLRIRDVHAWAVSFPVPAEHSVRLGVGRAVKRDAVVVRVRTECGLIGYGESHHCRAHTTVAHFINTALADLLRGRDAGDTAGAWEHVYARQLVAMGLGTGCVVAYSGVDMALWDVRGKAAGLPLYRLLGGGGKPVPAYAGGVALGWQAPDALADEALRHVAAGYRAVKLRLGDTPARDLARVAAVRRAVGQDVAILADANTAYSLQDARTVMPGLDQLDVGWLEEPFAPQDTRAYATARAYGTVPFAAGENHYTRFEFARLVDEAVVAHLQPDLSKAGGITETLRIAALGSARRLPVHLHTSMTGLNMAASIHVLSALDNAGYFEADVSRGNRFRDEMVSEPFRLDEQGCVRPCEAPGIGVQVDEAFIQAHPPIEGPAYV